MRAFVVYPAWHISASMLAKKLSWNMFEMSNKLNKILLKGLNPNICKVGGLNWVMVSERD